MAKKKNSGQDLKVEAVKQVPPPKLSFGPPRPKRYNPPIGMIGCGGITEVHCKAYRNAGFNIVALCDVSAEQAEKRRAEFFPDAEVYTDADELLACDDIEVMDIATHPQAREKLIPQAIVAGKHVLSQKPFVLDLAKGQKFADLADEHGVKLAINQNGRWAPYFSWMRAAVDKGLLGDVMAVHLNCHWDHNWIRKNHFDTVYHIILYDFAIHWCDMTCCLMGEREARKVFATLSHAPGQEATPPLLGQIMVEFQNAQATLTFDASTRFGSGETALVIGTEGTITGEGAVCAIPELRFATKKGEAHVDLREHGTWFPVGFEGTMGELLCAIEQDREAGNSARNNLRSLALCFAAVASAESGKVVEVGKAKKVPVERCSVLAK